MVIVEKERLVEEVRQNAQLEIAELNEALEENKRFLSFLLFLFTLFLQLTSIHIAQYLLNLSNIFFQFLLFVNFAS